MNTVFLSVFLVIFLTACGEPLTLEQVRAKEGWCESEGGIPSYYSYDIARKYPTDVECKIDGLIFKTDHIQ